MKIHIKMDFETAQASFGHSLANKIDQIRQLDQ